jgi:hypothetical protein
MASTEEDDDARARRHAVWGLSVLVLLAVLVISVTLFFTGTPGGDDHGQRIDLAIPTSVPTPTQSAAPTTSAAPTAAVRSTTPPRRQPTTPARQSSASVSTSAPAPVHAPSPSRPVGNTNVPAAPCTGSAPCAVAGDGGITAAQDTARKARGAGPVRVTLSPVAQRCAASGGAQCPGQYAVQTATAQSGRQAIAALGASQDNGWLFAPATATLQIGWAYLPDLREYVVALLAQ